MPLDSYANLQLTVLDWLARPNDPLVSPAVPDMIAMFEEEARDRLQTRFVEKTVQLSPVPGQDTIPLPDDYGQLRSIWIDTANGKRHFQYQTPRNLDTNLRYLDSYPAAFTIESLSLRIVGVPVAEEPTEGTSGPVITLQVGTSATLYINDQIVPTSFVGMSPITSNAADAFPSVWVEAGTGTAVIHHASSPNADMTFSIIVSNATLATTFGSIFLDYVSGIPALSDSVPSNWLLAQYPSAYLWGTLCNASVYVADDPRLQLWLSARESAIERIRLADRRAKYPSGLMIQTDTRNP